MLRRMYVSVPWRWRRWKRLRSAGVAVCRGRRGGILVEVLAAVALFGIVGSAVATGLSTSQLSAGVTEHQSVAESVARRQMEYVFSLPYQEPPSTYPSVDAPPGFSVTAEAEEYVVGDLTIEKVVVTVSRDGQGILALESLRTKELAP